MNRNNPYRSSRVLDVLTSSYGNTIMLKEVSGSADYHIEIENDGRMRELSPNELRAAVTGISMGFAVLAGEDFPTEWHVDETIAALTHLLPRRMIH